MDGQVVDSSELEESSLPRSARVDAAKRSVKPAASAEPAIILAAANETLAPPIVLPPVPRRGFRLRQAAGLVRRVLIFGTGERALQARKVLLESDCPVDIVGFYASPKEPTGHISGVAVFGPALSLKRTAVALKADEIVIAVQDRRGGVLPLRELLDCRLHGIRIYDLVSHFEEHLGELPIDAINASWLIFGDGFRQGPARKAVKRAFDVFCSLALLILGLPIMALAALCIAAESGLPVLYRQERVGMNNRRIYVIKFRSMRVDAEKEGKPIWASTNDSRVTRVGKIIRKLRIDELPQLVSVLKGDMSLVGPRPERPFFVEQLTAEIPYYAVRHSLKPGLTGWAQVRYQYGACKEESAKKLQYDLYYVKNHSLLLDLKILFATIAVVLTGKGAQ